MNQTKLFTYFGKAILARFVKLLVLFISMLAVAGCTAPQVTSGINDPYEAQNRVVHEGNRSLDRFLLRPASEVYGTVLPQPVQNRVSNFASNLSVPGTVVNDLLQVRLADAIHNSTRFLVNSTIGLAGLFDPATSIGIEPRPSDFGETLSVWGASEGHYVELPVAGPSTKRDTIGLIVDVITNPVGKLLSGPERIAPVIASAASTIGNRYRFKETFDSVLYDSEDSYAQARFLYLENRRFQLGRDQDDANDELYDLYEEFDE